MCSRNQDLKFLTWIHPLTFKQETIELTELRQARFAHLLLWLSREYFADLGTQLGDIFWVRGEIIQDVCYSHGNSVDRS